MTLILLAVGRLLYKNYNFKVGLIAQSVASSKTYPGAVSSISGPAPKICGDWL